MKKNYKRKKLNTLLFKLTKIVDLKIKEFLTLNVKQRFQNLIYCQIKTDKKAESCKRAFFLGNMSLSDQ